MLCKSMICASLGIYYKAVVSQLKIFEINIVTFSHQVAEAVQFLHDLGSVQHFHNDFLKSRVVINPQWIVDAMACVVSVHDTPIKV